VTGTTTTRIVATAGILAHQVFGDWGNLADGDAGRDTAAVVLLAHEFGAQVRAVWRLYDVRAPGIPAAPIPVGVSQALRILHHD
jgi:hypothetical protein